MTPHDWMAEFLARCQGWIGGDRGRMYLRAWLACTDAHHRYGPPTVPIWIGMFEPQWRIGLRGDTWGQ